MCLEWWKRGVMDQRGRTFQKPIFSPHRQTKTHPQGMLWCGVWASISRWDKCYLIFLENTAAQPQLLPKARLHLCPFLECFINHFTHISFHLRLQILISSGIYSNTCGFSKCKRHVLGWRCFHRGWLDSWDSPRGSWLRWNAAKGKQNFVFLTFFIFAGRGRSVSISIYVSSPWSSRLNE